MKRVLFAAWVTVLAGCGGTGPASGFWSKVMDGSMVAQGGGAITVDGPRILVGSGEVFVSEDDGASWLPHNAGLPANTPIQALIGLDDRVLAGLDQGVFASRDHGVTWTQSDTGVPSTVSAYAFFSTGTSVLLGMNAGSGGPGPTGGLFRTIDKGVTWLPASSGLPQSSGASSFASLGIQVFACAAGKVATSTNDGQIWQTKVLPAGNALSIVNQGGTLYVTSSAGTVFKSADGTTWVDSGGHGLPADDPSDFLFTTGGALYATAFASKPHGVYVSRDNGTSWAAFNDSLTDLGAVPRMLQLVVHDNELFGVDDTANVWRRPL